MQKITPFLWFDNNAEEAMNFYVSVFKDATITSIQRWGKDQPGPEGEVMTGGLTLFGQEFAVLNGGPLFKFTEAISFVVHCDSQAEVDEYWNRLTADGGQESMCGWLKDRFGLSWQIIPREMMRMIGDSDRQKSGRAMQAMMKMKKIDLQKMRDAFEDR